MRSLLFSALLGASVRAETKRLPPVGQRLVDVLPNLGRTGPALQESRATWKPRRPAKAEAGQDCFNFAGVYTGYEGSSAIGDAYRLSWRGPAFNTDGSTAFSAMYITPASWSLGLGLISPDNTTVSINLDGGRVLLNGTLADNCTTIYWDNDTAWKKTLAMPKRVHMISMNHLDGAWQSLERTHRGRIAINV